MKYISKIILTGEDGSTSRKSCPNVTLPTTNPYGPAWNLNCSSALTNRQLTTRYLAWPCG